MKLTCILVIFGLVQIPTFQSEESIATIVAAASNLTSTTTTTTATTTQLTDESTTFTIVTESIYYRGDRGLYGGSYYNDSVDNPYRIHYMHGLYKFPRKNYYSSKKYSREDETNTTLDYYLGYGISKMTDTNFKYENFHHYYNDLNRTISENETIRMDHIIDCHPNATFFCPENTETVCMLNGTIYCMSKMSVVGPCVENDTMGCVNSTVPCVTNCLSVNDYLEEISLPCLANIIIVDVYEDKNGMTISRVSGTFILVPALNIEDRMFCVSVIADPVSPVVP